MVISHSYMYTKHINSIGKLVDIKINFNQMQTPLLSPFGIIHKFNSNHLNNMSNLPFLLVAQFDPCKPDSEYKKLRFRCLSN